MLDNFIRLIPRNTPEMTFGAFGMTETLMLPRQAIGNITMEGRHFKVHYNYDGNTIHIIKVEVKTMQGKQILGFN